MIQGREGGDFAPRAREVIDYSKNYYAVLGIQPSATAEQIKSAWRREAVKYHPDTHPGDAETVAKFREAEEAYRILSDTGLRSMYDTYSVPVYTLEIKNSPEQDFNVGGYRVRSLNGGRTYWICDKDGRPVAGMEYREVKAPYGFIMAKDLRGEYYHVYNTSGKYTDYYADVVKTSDGYLVGIDPFDKTLQCLLYMSGNFVKRRNYHRNVRRSPDRKRVVATDRYNGTEITLLNL